MYLMFYVVFLFIIYSFLGWIIEELYSFFNSHHFQEEGFLTIPLKPMYGISMTSLIIINEILNISNIYLLLLCLIMPSFVEYISGYLLDYLFNKKYWDYSSLKHNINGYVCLKFSLYWTILSFVGVLYINPIIKNFYINNFYVINISTLILLFIFIGDFIMTLKKYLYI